MGKRVRERQSDIETECSVRERENVREQSVRVGVREKRVRETE